MKVDDETNALTSHLKSEFQSHIGGMATLSFLEFCKKSNLLKKSTSPKTILLIAVIVAFIDEMHLALGGRSRQ
jgi:hypothetical protein